MVKVSWRLLSVLWLMFVYATSAQAGSVKLTWQAPTTSADGTPLTDLSRYFVYQGRASRQYDQHVDVGLATSAALSGLTEGQTYYFAVTALDTFGNESVDSNEVSITMPATPPPPPPPPGDTTLPTVTLVSPTNGAAVPRRGTVTMQAQARDNSGTVDRVVFFVDGGQQCADGESPYTCTWQVPAANKRTYRLQAKAFDRSGNVGNSPVIEVTAQ